MEYAEVYKLYTDSHDEVAGMLNLFVLMYADDTVIIAENEHDMQRNLNLFNDYCNYNKRKVNISKTEIMVFARSKTRLNNIPTFKFGNIDDERVEDYIYLGICFNWNGSFVKAKKLLHDKALKAIYSLIRTQVADNAQCTPTDWQSVVGDIANCRLRIGVRR